MASCEETTPPPISPPPPPPSTRMLRRWWHLGRKTSCFGWWFTIRWCIIYPHWKSSISIPKGNSTRMVALATHTLKQSVFGVSKGKHNFTQKNEKKTSCQCFPLLLYIQVVSCNIKKGDENQKCRIGKMEMVSKRK